MFDVVICVLLIILALVGAINSLISGHIITFAIIVSFSVLYAYVTYADFRKKRNKK